MEIEEDMPPLSGEDKGRYFADAQIKRLLLPLTPLYLQGKYNLRKLIF